jgi:hypothetical protein
LQSIYDYLQSVVTQATHGIVLETERFCLQVFIVLQATSTEGTLYFDGAGDQMLFCHSVQQLSQWNSYENGFAERRKSL